MTSSYISLALYIVGAVFFISWFVVASGLSRDNSDTSTVDQSRRSRMNLLLGLGFAALLAGAAVAYFR